MATRLKNFRVSRVDRVWAPANGTEEDGPLAKILIAKAQGMTCPECGSKLPNDMSAGDKCPSCGYTMTAQDMMPMNKAQTKSEGDAGNFPASDYAYVPDPNSPSTWKLRLTASPGGSPDSGIVGAAVAALGAGFRGNKVQIPSAALPGVKAKVRAAWNKANPDKTADQMPMVIKSEGGSMPTDTELQSLQKAIDDAIAEAVAPLNDKIAEFETQKTEFDAAVAANTDPAELEKAQLPESVRKRLEEAEAIAKAAEERVTAIEHAAEAARWYEVAKGLPFVSVAKATGGDAATDTGKLLHSIAKSVGVESAEQMKGLLEAAQSKLAQSELLKAAGQDGSGSPNSADAQLRQVAKDLIAKDPNLSMATAITKAALANPELAMKSQEELFNA